MEMKLINAEVLNDRIYKDMKKQFPPEELKSFNAINDLLTGGRYKLDLLIINGHDAGYILYYKSDFLWIDYIAILPEYQSCGLGSKVLQLFFDKYKMLKGCYFEVEKENPQDKNTIRRVKFYKRNGCEVLDFKYYFPNDVKLLEMDLYYKNLSGVLPAKTRILEDIEEIFGCLHVQTQSCMEILELIKKENKCGS